MIEGAVHNTAVAHPDWQFHPRAARSVAKRAAGTISAAWPGLLAVSASKPSDMGGGPRVRPSSAQRDQLVNHVEKGGAQVISAALVRMHRKIGKLAGHARKNGNPAALAAYADALRLIAKEIAKLESPASPNAGTDAKDSSHG